MVSELQRSRLREDIGANETSLPDADADAIYTEAAETHATAGAAQDALARVIAIRRLLASSAKLTTYRQNASSENASDVFQHLQQLLGLWQGELAAAVRRSAGAARFGSPKRVPPRIREYPDG